MIPDPGARRVAGFLVLSLFLIIGADYESTERLAVAFAYLILLVALMNVGPVVFDRLSAMFPAETGSYNGAR